MQTSQKVSGDTMTHQPKPSYSYDDLIACAKGELFGPGNAQLPMPPMLMFDRITSKFRRGRAAL
jgi:3-hydroxyacyl-[acyl-carrier protein] dehydratase/trans-2-decenoyl-[acyl-carrier protein] isomerase